MIQMKRLATGGLFLGLFLAVVGFGFFEVIVPRLDEDALRQEIEKCVKQEFGASVIWDERETKFFLTQGSPPALDSSSSYFKNKLIPITAWSDSIQEVLRGIELVHLKKGAEDQISWYFFETRMRTLPTDSLDVYLCSEEGRELLIEGMTFHCHQQNWFSVDFVGDIPSFHVGVLRHLFPFSSVKLSYLGMRARPGFFYASLLGYLLFIGGLSLYFGVWVKSKIKLGLKSRGQTSRQDRVKKVVRVEEAGSKNSPSSFSLPAPLALRQEMTIAMPEAPKPSESVSEILIAQSGPKSGSAMRIGQASLPARLKDKEYWQEVKPMLRYIRRHIESLSSGKAGQVELEKLPWLIDELSSGRHKLAGARRLYQEALNIISRREKGKEIDILSVSPTSPHSSRHGPRRRLENVTAEDAQAVLTQMGYRFQRYSDDSHIFMTREGSKPISIPRKQGNQHILGHVLRKAGVDMEEFNRLLEDL